MAASGGPSAPDSCGTSGSKPLAAPPGVPPTPSTRSQLDQIAQSLQSSLVELQQRTATPKPATAALPADGAVAPPPPSRAGLVKKVKRYEAMLELYKDDEADPDRLALLQKVEASKAELAAWRPPLQVGAQFDNARSALRRAIARREEADKAFAAAKLLRGTAVAEGATVKAEVIKLEAMVVPPEAQSDLMASIQAQLGQLVNSIKADAHVLPEHVSNAEKHVRELVLGFTAVLQQANDAKDHAAKTQAADGIPRHRLNAKRTIHATTPLPEIPSHLVRHSKKQPEKTVPDNVFTTARRGRTGMRSRSRGRCLSAEL